MKFRRRRSREPSPEVDDSPWPAPQPPRPQNRELWERAAQVFEAPPVTEPRPWATAPPPEPLVVAAIDFGTHGSGYAWALVADLRTNPAGSVHVPRRWEGSSVNYPKNLSALVVDGDGKVVEWGYEALNHWTGAAGTSDLTYLHGFKMALRGGGETLAAGGIADAAELTPRQAAAHTTEYLRLLREAALEDIPVIEQDVRWCVTIPAIWDHYEEELMWRAAVAAGFPDDRDRMVLGREPEVAAIYCKVKGAHVLTGPGASAGRGASPTPIDLVRPGGRFVVVDAGGGTIDITAYEVDNFDGRLHQIGRIDGAKLGAEYLTNAFLRKVLAPKLGGFTEFLGVQKADPDAVLKLLRDWDAAKDSVRLVDGRAPDPVLLDYTHKFILALRQGAPATLRELQERGEDMQLVVTPEEVTEIFESVVAGIVSHIDEQLALIRRQRGPADGLETVLLVGGFSRSPYLRRRLAEHLEGTARLVAPADAAEAVLCGAVHFAHDPRVIKSRRAKHTYGIEVLQPYDPVRHADRSTITNDSGIWVTGVFEKTVGADQAVRSDAEYEHHVYPVESGQERLSIAVHRSSTPDPRYVDDAGCEKLGEFVLDVSPTVHLPRAQREYVIYVRFGHTRIDLRAVDVNAADPGTGVPWTVAYEPPDGTGSARG